MNRLGKVLISLLCALTLLFACGCNQTPLSLLLPAHEGEKNQEPLQSEEETEQEQPPAQDDGADGEQETEEEQEEEEQPVSPPQTQEKITVWFIFFDESSATKEFDKGAVVTMADAPDFTGETGYRYVWDFDGVPLSQDVTYYQTRYTSLSSASEFMQIREEENYFLEEDITLSDFSTLPTFQGVIDGNGKTLSLTVRGQTKTLIESFCGTLKNLAVKAVFEGFEAISGRTAQECALFKDVDNALFKNCKFTVEYKASATANKPSAGLAINLLSASFENCTLQTQADGMEHIYAVCYKKSSSVTLAGLTVVKNDLEDYKISN